jgi:hypothetical protein
MPDFPHLSTKKEERRLNYKNRGAASELALQP